MAAKVDIGIAKKLNDTESWKLRSRYFPSKIGGRPSWLALDNLMAPDQLACKSCGRPMLFVAQLYAPIDCNANAFHRSLFIFSCPNQSQCKCPTMKAFRCQLKRENKYYDSNAPEYDNDQANSLHPCPGDFNVKLCQICGCLAKYHCGKCSTPYCSRDHQVLDWKDGHRMSCSSESGKSDCINAKAVLPEFELVIDVNSDTDEETTSEDDDDDDDLNESNRVKEFDDFVKRQNPDMQNVADEEFSQFVNGTDETFIKFQNEMKKEPKQVVRYYNCDTRDTHNIEPLWVTNDNKQSADQIPPCSNCGSMRRFEFQVMPQMLDHFGTNYDLDWGILAIWTCSQHCNSDTCAYHEEILYRQCYALSS